MKKLKLILFFVIFAFTLHTNAAENNGVYTFTNVEQGVKGKAVDFTFNMNGKDVKFSDFTKNKVVFLNFWGTWCPPCRKEIPDIIEIVNELNPKDFVVIGVASERGDLKTSVEKVSQYVSNNKLNYINIVMDSKTQELKQAYMKATENPLQYVPTTIIIDKEGKIHHLIIGGRDKAGFMQALKELL